MAAAHATPCAGAALEVASAPTSPMWAVGFRSVPRFVSRPEEVKPGVHMPAFGMLPARDLEHLTFYLKALE